MAANNESREDSKRNSARGADF